MIDFAAFEKDVEFRTLTHRGGQHVGVDASVIAIHKPTGIAVYKDSERSQMANKAAAVARLLDVLQCMGLVKCTCET